MCNIIAASPLLAARIGYGHYATLVVLVVALVERWTRDRKVAGSTPGRGAIKSTRPLSLPSLRGR